MDAIWKNIVESVASDVPRIEALKKEIEQDRRLLYDKERDLRNKTESAHILCSALWEAKVPHDNKQVSEFCQREARRRENEQRQLAAHVATT